MLEYGRHYRDWGDRYCGLYEQLRYGGWDPVEWIVDEGESGDEDEEGHDDGHGVEAGVGDEDEDGGKDAEEDAEEEENEDEDYSDYKYKLNEVDKEAVALLGEVLREFQVSETNSQG